MTRIRRTSATAALLGLLALLPAHASAATLVPFQATVFEHFTVSACGTLTRCITATGTGQATHLGAVTESAYVSVDINPADAVDGCAPEMRKTTLTAANGDEIRMSATGLSCPPNSAHDSYAVTGGTGRFQGAFGTGADSNVHQLTGPGGGIAWVTFTGNLSSPGSLAP